MESSNATASLRRLGAAASLVATATVVTTMGLREHDFVEARWGLVAVGAVTAAGALALLRRSMLAQVLGRGIAWVTLLPTLVAALGALVDGHRIEPTVLLLGATAAGALLLGRPGLNGPEARREFSPDRYRRWFLTGAVMATTTAFVAAFSACEAALSGSLGTGLGLASLSAALLAAVLGVVRMRAWGVLLGGLTAAVMLVAAAFAGSEVEAVALGLAALPGLVLIAPLAAARLARAREERDSLSAGAVASGLRAEAAEVHPAVRTRIALTSDAGDLGASHEPEPDEAIADLRRAPSPASR